MTREKSPIAKSLSAGFTIIELAAAIVILSLLLVMAVGLIKSWLSQDDLMTNQQRLDTIQQSLTNYEIQYNRLPCPASFTAAASSTSYGRESTSCTGALAAGTYSATGRTLGGSAAPGTTPMPAVPSSSIIFGALPVRDLGLPDSYRLNTSGYAYTYAVSKSETSAVTALNPYAGVINIVDNSTPVPKTVLPLASDGVTSGTALYAVVDHGKDGKGAHTASGNLIACSATGSTQDSYNCNYETAGAFTAFRSATFSKKPGGTWFDDMLVYNTSITTLANLSGVMQVCTTTYSNSSTAGSSGGYDQFGVDSGMGGGFNILIPLFIINFEIFAFAFADLFDVDAAPSGSFSATAHTTGAYCPDTSYHIVTGGCTQTSGVPKNSGGAAINAAGTNGPISNIYGADILVGGVDPGANSHYYQFMLPPASHPAAPNSVGLQGWECNGSSASGMYTQAYAVCCTGSGKK